VVRSLNGGGLENSLYTEGRLMRKSILLTVVLVSLLALIHAGVGLAAEWQQDNTGWKYQNDDGSYSTSKWQEIGGKHYYFDENSYILKDTTTPDGYQVGRDGAWIQEVNNGRSINYDILELYAADVNLTCGELVEKYGEQKGDVYGSTSFKNSPLNTTEHVVFRLTDGTIIGEETRPVYSTYGFDDIKALRTLPPIVKDEDKPKYITIDGEQLFPGVSLEVAHYSSSKPLDEVREILSSFGINNLKVLDKKINYNWKKYDGTSGTSYTHPTNIRFSVGNYYIYLFGSNEKVYFPRMIEVYPRINAEKEKKFNESEYSKDQYWGEITIH